MAKCCHCEEFIESGMLFGFWGPEENTKPICIKCLKKILDSEGKDIGIKNRIKKWLSEENISFNEVKEPKNVFHFALEDIGPLKMRIEVFQDKNNLDVITGFMTFLSKELTFNLYRFTEEQKEDFKRKVDDFLSTLRVDYRTGIRVGYEIISERGHYGAKYFIRAKQYDLDKEKFLRILDMTKETGLRSDEFLNQTLKPNQ
ncbi:hypothetical protein AAA799B03_00474 [Marine Group I thaumarchaeote SCGC AAA799-B03]|uniref:Uncharacterized protein n=4 Tax=Marine Group I TaxID=905826 RepID=A0A087S875_9ARCH|nr:hypothetical protein AAA799N04_00218 [Marine Group I thaumarchaeote SCGC AAA799-N04]KFM15985.1 hypothetical protein AAA799D11_00774 [Marine Group I thaumarchaeote SCGC AAA799-D11]KFM17722.1 hypothetical protein SCCGRSA3_01652 [Marine Group I thaumarchaeote SCGC RSA3]KFM21929.1 hypothetical protein AAA799B03_00474 [Marine Group I thaumarchaeote SCGC AAA799-B03]